MATKRKRSSTDEGTKATKAARADEAETEGTALGFGINCFGQVGVGEQYTERKKPQVVKGIEQTVVSVAAGGMHSIVATTDGKLFTWGCNDEGCLGRTCANDDDYCIAGEAKVEGDLKFVNVCAGDSHSAGLTDEGYVYACGCFRDSSGKLGFDVETTNQRTFKCVYDPNPTTRHGIVDPAVQISSGADHLVILLASGKVLTMGTAEQGQLGRIGVRYSTRDSARDRSGNTTEDQAKRRTTHDTLEKFLIPHPIKGRGLKKVTRIGTGSWSTYLLDDKGQAWACGLNNYGQLGVDSGSDTAVYNVRRAKQWKSAEPLESLTAGQHHAVGLSAAGDVFSVGRGDCGQLGHDSRDEYQVPAKVAALAGKKIASVACGAACSFAVTDKGEGYAWGFGENLQLTTGEEEDSLVPIEMAGRQLETRTIAEVSAGGQHTVLLGVDA